MNNPRVVSQTLLRVGIKCAMHEFDSKTNTHYFLMREEEVRQLTRDAKCSLLNFYGFTPTSVCKVVADFYGITLEEMLSKARPARIAWPRQVAMTLLRRCSQMSLNEVGQFFGGRDHGTVLHAERRVAEREQTEKNARAQIEALTAAIKDAQGERQSASLENER